ncbi:MAG TPA: mechanosensitive ion channel domain-containing protein [Woeseiaceae bacterium]|nr:mechanosensitive ion channel domain-containing protein [Woeseiaceae bacterium]
MWDRAREIWAFPLLKLGENNTIEVGQLVLVLLLLAGGYLASRLVERTIRRRLEGTHLRPDAVHALQRIVFYVLLAIVGMMALSLLRIPLTAFAFVSGAIAIGVGFGAQNIINNFISSWILMWERPVRIDDFVEIDSASGTVERIGNRSTRIRRVDGVHMLVPNSHMLERTVVNWTLVDRRIRSVVRVGVAYGSPAKKVAELIRQALAETANVLQEPEPVVVLEDFGDNAMVFEAYFWAELSDQRQQRQIRSDIRFRIDELFRDNSIVIAFPQRDVHLDGLGPLEVRLLRENQPEAGRS